jgi:hypothetical protein
MLIKHTKNAINAPLLKRWLKALRAMDVWQIYMYILVHDLGMDAGEVLFYNAEVAPRAQKMLDELIDSRRQEQPNIQSGGNRWVRKWRTMKQRLSYAEQIAPFSPSYARHEKQAVLLKGITRLFAKDRHWE